VTLADEILASEGEPLAVFGLPIGAVKFGIQRAQRFFFSAEAAEAVINLLHSKPSSLLEAATNFARLPYPHVWIEWPSPDIVPMLPTQIRANRVGVILEATGPRSFMVVSAWSFDKRARQREVDKMGDGFLTMAKTGVSEMCAQVSFENLEPNAMPDLWEPHPDPKEQAAAHALGSHIGFYVLDRKGQMKTPFEAMVRVYGREYATSKLVDIAQEIKPVLGMLILLNSKNCVSMIPAEPPAALNKARVKRGRSPLVSYTNVSINLGRRDGRQAEAHGMSAAEVRQHLVRGHFKIRKTGVYWWRNHIRGVAGAVEHKSYRVSA
jgi:hypothetical protein